MKNSQNPGKSRSGNRRGRQFTTKYEFTSHGLAHSDSKAGQALKVKCHGQWANRRGRRQTQEKSFECIQCDNAFNTADQLKTHMECHKPNKCRFCDFATSTRVTLNMHVQRRHTKERPFKCLSDRCSKVFCTNRELKEHARTHAGEKSFTCSICNKSVTHCNSFKRHLKLHEGVSTKVLQCGVCDKKFRTPYHLQRHLLVHTGEKPFICRLCDRPFRHKHNLDNHIRLHVNEKSHECDICGTRFLHSGSFTEHKKTKCQLNNIQLWKWKKYNTRQCECKYQIFALEIIPWI